MDTIKIYSKAKKWLDTYLGYVNKCLNIKDNLSDIQDKQAARENLELSSKNVTNHKHNSRYVPMIENEATERQDNDNAVLDTIATETTNHENAIKSASDRIVATQNSLDTAISSAEQTLFNAETNVQNNINALAQKGSLNIATTSVSGSTVSADSFCIGTSGLRKRSNATSSGPNYYKSYFYTNKTIGSTTTTLADLICQLVACSHTHQSSSETINCNCDCVCRG